MSKEINVGRRRFLITAAMAVAAAEFGLIGCTVQQVAAAAAQLTSEGDLPSLDGATGWINSPPLTSANLRGKVVLVDFWTYTCINWRRSFPYVRAWAEKYKTQGLVVIGVHTPEFEFEQNIANVRQAAREIMVDYPIAVDTNYAIWNAFNNQYWPALYIVDAQGHIRHHAFGEGDYGPSEKVIQQLLSEAGIKGVSQELVSVNASGAERRQTCLARTGVPLLKPGEIGQVVIAINIRVAA